MTVNPDRRKSAAGRSFLSQRHVELTRGTTAVNLASSSVTVIGTGIAYSGEGIRKSEEGEEECGLHLGKVRVGNVRFVGFGVG